MTARRYLLRDPGSGKPIGRAYASLGGAIRRARQMSRSVSHAVPVWWIDDTGKPKVVLGSATAGVWLASNHLPSGK
jgi:hypothetical protein